MTRFVEQKALSVFKMLLPNYIGPVRFHWFFNFRYINETEEMEMYILMINKTGKLSIHNIYSLMKRKKYEILHDVFSNLIKSKVSWKESYCIYNYPMTRVRLHTDYPKFALFREDEKLLDIIIQAYVRFKYFFYWQLYYEFVKTMNLSKKIVVILYYAGYPENEFTPKQTEIIKKVRAEQHINVDKTLAVYIYIKNLNAIISDYLGPDYRFITI